MSTLRLYIGILSLLIGLPSVVPDARAQEVPAPLQRLQTLLGHAVQDQHGNNLGHLNEVVLEASTGDVVYGVVAVGGVVGLGGKQFAIPWHILQQPVHDGSFRLTLTTDQLKNAPSFEADEWPDMEDRHWDDAIHAYYGNIPALGKRLPPKTAQEAPAEQVPHRLLRATYVLKSKVMNTQGQRLGDLKEMVIDTATANVAYVVLAFGGVMGVGEKWFAVPWRDLRQSGGLGTFTLDVDKEDLQEAPGFDKDRWPTTAPSWKE